jgi:hypothetical protein
MRKPLLLLFLSVMQLATARTWNHINPILGDQSYLLKYGEAPNDFTPDQIRIATHLEYAEYVLRSKDVSGMSAEQIRKRTHLLDLLHKYWTRGVFPKNTDVPGERRPCFIDHNGTICAVGYLVEQTVGRDIAELISERFMYNEILEMNDPVVINWIEECGLTREECAIIQPSYGPRYSFDWQLWYGPSIRLNDNGYHAFGIERSKYNGGRGYSRQSKGSRIQSAGLRFDYLNNGNFSASAFYSKAMTEEWANIFYLGIAPECFKYNNDWGMNLRPEFKLAKSYKCIDFGLSYSYLIPITNEDSYEAGRHDITAHVGFIFTDLKRNKLKLPKLPRKPKVDKPTDAGNAFR